MSTLVSRLQETANKVPEQIALQIMDQRIEYERLLTATQKLAHGLQQLGVKKGDRVAVLLPNIAHFPICTYAILHLGAIVVPLNFMYNANELAFYLNDCGSRVLITWVGFKDLVLKALHLAPKCQDLIFLGEKIPQNTLALTQLIESSPPLQTSAEIDPQDIAVINYTAGITGEAHGAELTHESICAIVDIGQSMFKIDKRDCIAGIVPLFHPFAQMMAMHMSFLHGATCELFPRLDSATIVESMARAGITFLPASPGVIRAMVPGPESTNPLPDLRLCLCYGGKLDSEVVLSFEEKYQTLLLEAYGLTEAGSLVACQRFEREKRTGSVGVPLMGIEVQIRDDKGQLLQPHTNGEIWVKSPGMMTRYFGQPEETNKRMVDGWLFTGDMGYLDMYHNLYVQERKENIITKAGFTIFPNEVEEVLLSHEAVSEAAIIGLSDPVYGEEVHATVVLEFEKSATEQELIAFCQEYLPVYKSPKFIEFSSSLPKNATGRILRRFLKSIQTRIGDQGINHI